MTKTQTWSVLVLGLAAVAGFNSIAVPVHAGAPPTSISSTDDRSNDLRARLADAKAELDSVKQDIVLTSDSIAEVNEQVELLKKLYEETRNPELLAEIEALSQSLAELNARLERLVITADKLARYISYLEQQLGGDEPSISIIP